MRITTGLRTPSLADTARRRRSSQLDCSKTCSTASNSTKQQHLHHEAADTCSNNFSIIKQQKPSDQFTHQQPAPTSVNKLLHFQTCDRPVAYANSDCILVLERTNYQFHCQIKAWFTCLRHPCLVGRQSLIFQKFVESTYLSTPQQYIHEREQLLLSNVANNNFSF